MDFLKVPPGEFPPFDTSFTFRQTQSPNPQWAYGQKVEDTPEGKAWMAGEKDGWKVVDTSKEDPLCVCEQPGFVYSQCADCRCRQEAVFADDQRHRSAAHCFCVYHIRGRC